MDNSVRRKCFLLPFPCYSRLALLLLVSERLSFLYFNSLGALVSREGLVPLLSIRLLGLPDLGTSYSSSER